MNDHAEIRIHGSSAGGRGEMLGAVGGRGSLQDAANVREKVCNGALRMAAVLVAGEVVPILFFAPLCWGGGWFVCGGGGYQQRW